jgi:8-amino-3,8-dideoxy-alpha-D-manno-octulosonate transaminase
LGLAQIKKLPKFLAIQRKNHSIIKNILAEIPEVSFRKIPDETGDSCTFLSWFLPTESMAQKVTDELKAQNILAGNFYWYNNNWHYIRNWHHLKNVASLYPLHSEQAKALNNLKNTGFSASDQIMSRCISTAIGLLWTEEQTIAKAQALKAAILKSMVSG